METNSVARRMEISVQKETQWVPTETNDGAGNPKWKSAKRERVDLNKPIVVMTPAEQEYADSVIREHFDEDRTEIVSNVRFDARHTK